ncbi:MAG: putative Ig domain-containing protein [Acidobacteriia bacterium]|nr:putative Ig domain-containing protein [Terriglobia bacterium]
MSKQITIRPGGAFDQIEVEQSDDVFWSNNDSNPHWPVPWCYGLRVDPGKPSNSFQAVPGGTLPQKLIYQDALSNQSGVMMVYADFAPQSGPFAGTAGQNSSISMTSGGKSPYNTSASAGVPSWITFAESTPGNSSGFNAVLTNPPAGSVTFNLNATDGLGYNIQQPITITVYPAFQLVPGPYNAHAGQNTSIPLAQGGQSPYNTSPSTGVPSWITLAQSTSQSNGGVFAVLTNPPRGSATFQLNATDAQGNNIQQQITITVT